MESTPALDRSPIDAKVQQVILQICEEAAVAADRRCDEFWVNLGKPGIPSDWGLAPWGQGPQIWGNSWNPRLGDSARWGALKTDDTTLKMAVLMTAASCYHQIAALGHLQRDGVRGFFELSKPIVSELLRSKLPFKAEQLRQLLQLWLEHPHTLENQLPGPAILTAAERYASEHALDDDLKDVLAKIKARALAPNWDFPPNKFHRQAADRIEKLLDPGKTLPAGLFADGVSQWLQTLMEEARERWSALVYLTLESGDKPTPSGKWLNHAKAAIATIARADLTARILQWMEETTPDPARPDDSLDVLKGMLWLSVLLDQSALAAPMGRFAEKCFRKVPGWGPRSVKLGNAALSALAEMAGEPRAAAELFRLKERVRSPSARKVIDKHLAELGVRTGQSLEAMEDVSLPDFGLDANSAIQFRFGEACAERQVHAAEVKQQWSGANGKPVKSIPSEVRAAHAAELAAFKQTAKDIEAARAAQVLRLEQSWVEERSWDFTTWQKHWLGHSLRRPIVEALIWCVGDQLVIPQGGALKDLAGGSVNPKADAAVKLWHPLDSKPDDVLAWRRRIMDLGLTQPIKQAHREIYVLTDAERLTRVYSNRFAAHILRQHQFRALCQARGWKFDLMGNWDGWNVPTRLLPAQSLKVEYQVDTVEDGQRSDTGVSVHLVSDQARFLNDQGEAVELEAIAPIIFSEVLRDVDLFVAVTSVANDPGWTDGGPDGRYGGYWREWAFGELGQSAATRKELISWIAPRLSIAGKLEIGNKSLIVRGKRQKYAIHFGSSNIQILPDNRYLCIVPDWLPPEAANIRLPFSGDDLLSIILSKAFLLVDEDQIRDQTILRQL